ncbi:MAG: hypothetical protein JXA09_06815 [Anaerolineae bacterium]|nr:hypothetical protein [Anaerolineae bacterium]
MPALYAGAARRAITPDLAVGPVYLAGFQENRPATDVHDDLYVRALALRVGDASPPFLLAVCDLIGLLHADVRAVRRMATERGLDARALVVACTHTHSGPDTIGLWGRTRFRSGVDRGYVRWLCERIVDALAAANDALAPARLQVGRTELHSWLRNARDPGIVDRELSVLRAVGEDGSAIFCLLNLACHPEVMFGGNRAITADYAGAACRAVEAAVGGTAVFASADIGGMMTPDVARADRTFDTVERMGRDVASTALAALEGGIELQPNALRFHRADVHLPLRNPLFKFAMAIGVLPRLTQGRDSAIATQVWLLDLGPARLVGIPGELLPGPGLALRAMLGAPYRFLIGLADDELGYLLPSDQFTYPRNPLRPGDHYEETMSLSRYTTPLLVEGWADLLAQAAAEERVP